VLKPYRTTTPRQLRATLIDRLVDYLPHTADERRPLRTMSEADMRSCVRRDLSWLLNTRTSIDGDRFDAEELSVIDYGMPDFGSYSPQNKKDRKRIAKRMKKAITLFEPRLQNVEVDVLPDMPDEKRLVATIQADLVIDHIREPVRFKTILDDKRQIWEVHEQV